MIAASFAGAAALLVWLWSGAAAIADLAVSPDQNVLLITVDTLRGDALGCAGGPARTPNIDALAAQGVRFSFAHAHAVVTLPSHASILTGTYPFTHGYRENSGYRLKQGVPTLAALLKSNGYATGAFVGAFPLDARFGLTPGFDVYDGRFDDTSGGGLFLAERPARAVVSRATEWIGRQSGRWFAWVHVYDPHAPYRPEAPFDTEYADRPYFGEVASVDKALGPLLDRVRQLARPTLVVFTADHGEALGEHGETTHGLFAYEPTLRVPLIMSSVSGGPARGGQVSSAPVRHIDIVPTILDVLQLPAAALPGHSLRTAADRESGRDRPSYFEAMSGMLNFGWAPLTGVVADRDKYIDLPMPELYDLRADPGEAANAIARDPARQRVLASHLSSFGAARPDAAAAESPEVAQRLQALGYVSGSAARKTRYTEDDDPKKLVGLDKMLHDAVALDEAGDLRQAIQVYRQILERRADMTAAARHLAFDYWRLGDASNAIAVLRDSIRASPTAAARVQLGTYLTDMGTAAEAVQLLEPTVASDPTLDALNALAIAYARAGRTREALATFDRSLQIDPSNPMTHENIGTVYLEAGDMDRARDEFRRALDIDPESAQSHAGLAMVDLKRGDRAGAIAKWRRAVELDANNFDALYNLSVQLVQTGQSHEARPFVEQFVRTAPPALYAKEIRAFSELLRRMR